MLLQTASSEVQLVRLGTSAFSSSSPAQEQARGSRVRRGFTSPRESPPNLLHFLGVGEMGKQRSHCRKEWGKVKSPKRLPNAPRWRQGCSPPGSVVCSPSGPGSMCWLLMPSAAHRPSLAPHCLHPKVRIPTNFRHRAPTYHSHS